MNDSSQKTTNKVDSGRNITKLDARAFKRGSLMFIEGELSTEMYILRSGRVRIIKQEGDKTIELAVLSTGSVLGELSLLDNQPRSATAQILEDVSATVIDENIFKSTMKSIPNWLANIVQVIVTRLRNTMKKTSDSIVYKSVAGIIKLLILLYKHESITYHGEKRILFAQAKDAISSTIGIGEIEMEKVFLHLILKDMLYIRKDNSGKEYILITDLDLLNLYMTYLRTTQRGDKILGEDLDEAAIDLVQVILGTGGKVGRIVKPGIIRIGLAQIEIELQRLGKGKHIDLDALDSLLAAKVIYKEQSTVRTTHQAHKRIILLYNENTLKKLITLHLWLPKFKEEIIF